MSLEFNFNLSLLHILRWASVVSNTVDQIVECGVIGIGANMDQMEELD